jgi:hypothetical protein
VQLLFIEFKEAAGWHLLLSFFEIKDNIYWRIYGVLKWYAAKRTLPRRIYYFSSPWYRLPNAVKL